MRRAAALLALALAGCEPSAAADAAAPDSLQPLLQAYVRAAKPGETQATYQEMFDVVLRRVRRDYAGEIETANLVAAGIKAIEGLAPESESPAEVFKRAVNAALASLDPYSNYLDAGDLARLRSAIAGSFGGIGLEVDMVEGLVRAVAPIEDSPAARAGLKTGDLIVRIGDLPVLGLTLADAVSRLRGEPGTQVAIAIRRPGREDEFIVTLTREMIRSPVARARMEDDILVLRVSGFARSLKPMLEKAVADAQRERAPRGVIMDLRGNPGGTLDQAVVAADAFLTAGEIVSIRGRAASETRRWKADEAEVLAGVPMVVLIDGGSASASEIVAGALQDHGRATIMGRRSYGKGSVQTVIPLGGDKGALRLTTALYYTPSGRVVQRAGIGPDIELVPPDDAAQPRGGRREGDDARALPGAV
ncbi:MAG: S41 family peptidase, partial [Alphaproteobacteria bacterium]|nr:S41 family peptidase [Alphaproteobacteria bacterium]